MPWRKTRQKKNELTPDGGADAAGPVGSPSESAVQEIAPSPCAGPESPVSAEKPCALRPDLSHPAVRALFAVVREALAEGRDVRLPGLGVLKVRDFAARQGRNPRTGEEVTIPAGRRVRFGMADEMRSLVNS